MRTFLLPLLALVALAAIVVDASCSGTYDRTSPALGAIVVDATGKYSGSVKTVSAGVAKLSTAKTSKQTIFIRPGTYKEQVLIPALSGPLVVQGYTCNTLEYGDNQVTITHAMSQKDLSSSVTSNKNDLISTLRLKSSAGVRIYNVNIANTAGNVGQAVAAYVDASNHGFYACNFTGYQDTLCANKGNQLYARSYISGAIDFVFGLQAKAWFESCDIKFVGSGCVTANGNSASTVTSEYIFNKATVSGSGSGTAYLGRPWRPNAHVVFQNSNLGKAINSAGWEKWDSSTSTANVYFKEYNNSGTGASTSKRVSFSEQLKKAVAITDILGSSYKSQWYVDTDFL
ncbi:Pectinesterase [Phytophthora citrophthora]|uniref:Pectinesterase n=1 Tax=Phytophthora citrophthora TaxID=4793 RepID=A0AAD9GXJ9_9STRA|nr:Pectinesterase [Phytophthora citrophthora]